MGGLPGDSPSVRQRITRSESRFGFTLVELLISIVIIGILAALGSAAYIRTMAGAKVKSTQAVIETLNSGLQERLEVFRAVKVETMDPDIVAFAKRNVSDPTNPGSPAYRRAEILVKLSLARNLFPQQFWDIAPYQMDPSGNPYPPAVNMKDVDPAAGGALLREYTKNMRLSDTQMLSSYLNYVDNTTWYASFFPSSANTPASTLHDPDTESSECLHMILNWAPEGASITAASIPAQFKADTDGDGLMEFVDAWGRPLKFYRAPTDYYAYLIDVVREMQDPGVAANSFDPTGLLLDPNWSTQRQLFENKFGLLRIHEAYELPTVVGGPRQADSNPQPTVPRAYPTNPLIVSAGPDGKFGFWTPYSASENPPTRRDPHPITDSASGTGKFLHFRCGRVDPLEIEFVADNITNLNLAGSRGN